jgi:L-threonylcarbamoyladenylate synthase
MSPSGLLRFSDVEVVADALRQDRLAVLPTETGYLLGAVATSVPALGRAFAVKQRDPANPMHVACSSLAMARRFAKINKVAEALLEAFTPGPVTVIVEQTEALPRSFVTVDGTVGIRIPDHPATLQVISALGTPITATSLNRSGDPASAPVREVLEQLAWDGSCWPVPVVEVADPARYASPSTLVRATGPQLEVLRSGPVTVEDLERVRRNR